MNKVKIGTDIGAYAFDATAKTVTISGVGSYTVPQDDILAVIHAPTNTVLFQAALPSVALSAYVPAVGGGTLTLHPTIDTSAMTNSDTLFVLIAVPGATSPAVTTDSTLAKGSGVVSATTQRVTLATDGPGVANLATIATPVGTPGSAIPAKVEAVGGSDGTNLRTLKTSTDGTQLMAWNDHVIFTGSDTTGTGVVTGLSAIDIAGATSVEYVYHTNGGVSTFTHIVEFSDDGGTTWYTSAGSFLYVTNYTTTFSGPGRSEAALNAAATSPNIVNVPVIGKLMRVRVSAYTSGTLVPRVKVSRGRGNVLHPIYVTNTITATVASASIATAATTSGGATNSRTISANNTTGINVKATAGCINALAIENRAAADRYVKVYSKATAPTVGTDTPVFTFKVAANTSRDVYTGCGLRIATGIGIGITTGYDDADTGAPAAGDVIVNLSYT